MAEVASLESLLAAGRYKITSAKVPVNIVVQRENNGSYAVNVTCGLNEPVRRGSDGPVSQRKAVLANKLPAGPRKPFWALTTRPCAACLIPLGGFALGRWRLEDASEGFMARGQHTGMCPAAYVRVPPGQILLVLFWTVQVENAVQTPFKNGKVRIVFPANAAPENVKFVLKQLNPQAWHNCGGTDFHVSVRPAAQSDVNADGSRTAPAHSTPDTLLPTTVRNLLITIAEFENRAQLSLFQRFTLALEVVPTVDKADPEVRPRLARSGRPWALRSHPHVAALGTMSFFLATTAQRPFAVLAALALRCFLSPACADPVRPPGVAALLCQQAAAVAPGVRPAVLGPRSGMGLCLFSAELRWCQTAQYAQMA